MHDRQSCCLICCAEYIVIPVDSDLVWYDRPCAHPYQNGFVKIADFFTIGTREVVSGECEACGHDMSQHSMLPVGELEQMNLSLTSESFNLLLEEIFPSKQTQNDNEIPFDGKTKYQKNLMGPHSFVVAMPRILQHLVVSGNLEPLLRQLYDKCCQMMDCSTRGYLMDQFNSLNLTHTLKQFIDLMFSSHGNTSTEKGLLGYKGHEKYEPPLNNFKLDESMAANEAGAHAEFDPVQLAVENFRLAHMLLAVSELTEISHSDEAASKLRQYAYLAEKTLRTIDSVESEEIPYHMSLVTLLNRGCIGAGVFGKVYEVGLGRFRMALKITKVDLAKDRLEVFKSETRTAQQMHLQPETNQWSTFVTACMFVPMSYSYTVFADNATFINTLMLRYSTDLDGYIDKHSGTSTSFEQGLLYRQLESAYITYQIAVCLGQAHLVYGVIHGDLHAKNVLLNTTNGELDVFVADFGQSTTLSTAELNSGLTGSGTTAGSYSNSSCLNKSHDLTQLAKLYARLNDEVLVNTGQMNSSAQAGTALATTKGTLNADFVPLLKFLASRVNFTAEDAVEFLGCVILVMYFELLSSGVEKAKTLLRMPLGMRKLMLYFGREGLSTPSLNKITECEDVSVSRQIIRASHTHLFKRLASSALKVLSTSPEDSDIARLCCSTIVSLSAMDRRKDIGHLGAVEGCLQAIVRQHSVDQKDDLRNLCHGDGFQGEHEESGKRFWGALVSLTDECVGNCELFIMGNGMEVFYSAFDDHAAIKAVEELHLYMMLVVLNVAEIPGLRSHLLDEKYLNIFIQLLEKNDKVHGFLFEIPCAAAGVMSNILIEVFQAADPVERWKDSCPKMDLTDTANRILQAVLSWDLNGVIRFIVSTLEPITALLENDCCRVAQVYAAWRLANYTMVREDESYLKYHELVRKQGAVPLLGRLAKDDCATDEMAKEVAELSKLTLSNIGIETASG